LSLTATQQASLTALSGTVDSSRLKKDIAGFSSKQGMAEKQGKAEFGHLKRAGASHTMTRSSLMSGKDQASKKEQGAAPGERVHTASAGDDQGGAGGTADFPDSTRGSGGVNPTDMGTASPLDWYPVFDYRFPDFSAETFLAPTFHVGGRQRGRNQLASAKRRMKIHEQENADASTLTGIEPDPVEALRREILGPVVSADPALETTLDQRPGSNGIH
jgi:hypothetical protein